MLNDSIEYMKNCMTEKNFSLVFMTCGLAATWLGPTKELHAHTEHKC